MAMSPPKLIHVNYDTFDETHPFSLQSKVIRCHGCNLFVSWDLIVLEARKESGPYHLPSDKLICTHCKAGLFN